METKSWTGTLDINPPDILAGLVSLVAVLSNPITIARCYGRRLQDVLQQVAINALPRKHRRLTEKMAAIADNRAGIYLRWRLADEGRFRRRR